MDITKNNLSFSDFREGYIQAWTQGALFSSFTDIPANYWDKYTPFIDKNGIDKLQAKKIYSLPEILKDNNYNNFFIQGSSLNFTHTKEFLLSHGFEEIKSRYPDQKWTLT